MKVSSDALHINPTYLTEEFSSKFKSVLQSTEADDAGSCEPFPHFALKNFIEADGFMECLREELSSIEWHRKENDLYSLSQTADLASFGPARCPNLCKFREFMKTSVRDWLMRASGVELNETVAMTGSNYSFTDCLLPHDDELEGRRFAFVFYLTPGWKQQYGGDLKLFKTDENYRPVDIGTSLTPEENCMTLFEVSPKSWHCVAEVLSETEKRMSINGWFHGQSLPRPTALLIPQPSLPKIKPSHNVTYEEVLAWINPEYLAPDQQGEIRETFESESQIILVNFLKTDKYDEMRRDLLEGGKFKSCGPPNKRRYETLLEADTASESAIATCLRLFRSEAMCLLLSQWTGLNLHPLANQQQTITSSISDSEPQPSKKRKLSSSANDDGEDHPETGASTSDNVDDNDEVLITSEIRRFSHGSYSVVDDEIALDSEAQGFCLDAQMFFGPDNSWPKNSGGTTSYIAKDDEEELLSVEPRGNSLALVFREPDVFSFVKFVNARAGDHIFHSLTAAYFGPDDPEDQGDE
uniref:Prolyl 4-hydroxylase alpha subunit domain-containing protein n=1 Tax=Plectus sambesii TaxID=2011161 RepID=A0A914XI98_9BILA